MEKQKKRKILLCVIFLTSWVISVCLSEEATTVNEVGISEDELKAFNVTFYSEKEKLPLDKLITLEGISFNSSMIEGKYVLVNFWATWCPYCRREMPSKQWLYRELTDTKFTLLTISTGEKADTVTSYLKENNYTLPVVLDPENELKNIYAPRIPTSYILAPEGYIVARINNNKEWDSELALKVLRYFISGEYMK